MSSGIYLAVAGIPLSLSIQFGLWRLTQADPGASEAGGRGALAFASGETYHCKSTAIF
jgi:hypothetical protein